MASSNPKPKQPYRPHPPGYNSKAQIAARAQRAAARAERRRLEALAKAEKEAAKQRKLEHLRLVQELEARNAVVQAAIAAKQAEQERLAKDPRRALEAALQRLQLEQERWKANPASRPYNASVNHEDDPLIAKRNLARFRIARREAFRPLNAAKTAVYRAKKALQEFEEREQYLLACIKAGVEPKGV